MPLSIKQRGDRDISATVKRTTFKKVVPEAKADKWEALEICDKKGKPIVEEKKVERNIPLKEFARLESSFIKWGKDFKKNGNAASLIARVISLIDPSKSYTTSEIVALGITKPIQMTAYSWTSQKGEMCKGYGMIMKKTGSEYTMYPELIALKNKSY